jgi:2'-5' RNA ligase
MSTLLALDIAILPPPDIRQAAIALSAALPASESRGLMLDDTHLPHVTLSQHFVRADELDAALDKVDEVLRAVKPLPLAITGGGKSTHSVRMAVERTPALDRLHEDVMEAMRGFERPGGTPAAFFDGDARVADVVWVASYRLKSSFGAFAPHITLGHAEQPPLVAPATFTADTIAACHLGRFCTCRDVKRAWTLR